MSNWRENESKTEMKNETLRCVNKTSVGSQTFLPLPPAGTPSPEDATFDQRWVIGLAWKFLHRLRTEQTAFLIWGIQNFLRTTGMICSRPRCPISSWVWRIIVLVAKLVILWRMIWFVEITDRIQTRNFTGWLNTTLRSRSWFLAIIPNAERSLQCLRQ